ncbi:hypothetical protein DOTSEDRAFT_53193 [Dothistroma septosporum NZE10]|uniref:Rhodopsin domain-containing protein n=1 Tax=Dothistroma septosporum (strain NZE10 / CBS 128990) TaxID=675120 RepID=N1PLN8_DOTSN|nr:hypothetical protein DOTSEDRAFT_53193 [Dothistroma septosporum NZE10]
METRLVRRMTMWVLLSSILSCVGNALIVEACKLGFGKRQTDLIEFANPSMPYEGGPLLIEETMKIFFLDQVLYTVVMIFTKVSILLAWVRCFDTPVIAGFRRICWWLLGFIVAFYISAWTGHCHPVVIVDNLNLHWWIKANVNTGTDFLLSLLPVKYVLCSQRPLQEKKYSVGGVAIARVIRIPPSDFMDDAMYNSINFCLLPVLEDGMGIICACIPAFKEPTLRFFAKVLGHTPVNSRPVSGLSFLSRGKNSRKHSDEEKSLECPSHSTPSKGRDIYGVYDDNLYGAI